MDTYKDPLNLFTNERIQNRIDKIKYLFYQDGETIQNKINKIKYIQNKINKIKYLQNKINKIKYLLDREKRNLKLIKELDFLQSLLKENKETA